MQYTWYPSYYEKAGYLYGMSPGNATRSRLKKGKDKCRKDRVSRAYNRRRVTAWSTIPNKRFRSRARHNNTQKKMPSRLSVIASEPNNCSSCWRCVVMSEVHCCIAPASICMGKSGMCMIPMAQLRRPRGNKIIAPANSAPNACFNDNRCIPTISRVVYTYPREDSSGLSSSYSNLSG